MTETIREIACEVALGRLGLRVSGDFVLIADTKLDLQREAPGRVVQSLPLCGY